MGSDDGSPDAPKDPMTSLAEGAVQLHEAFMGWIEAGFTEWQACRIIGVMLAEASRQE